MGLDRQTDLDSEVHMSQQQTHQEARRREAEESIQLLYNAVDQLFEDGYRVDNHWKALEFVSWECGCLDYFKKLRSE